MFKKYRTKRLAKKIYIALLANPERYKYLTSLHKKGAVTQEELNLKNANKAYKLAETFINFNYIHSY